MSHFFFYSRSPIYSGAETMLGVLCDAIYSVSPESKLNLVSSVKDIEERSSAKFCQVKLVPSLEKISNKYFNLVLYFILGFRLFFGKDKLLNKGVVVFNDLESLISNWPLAVLNKSFFYLHDSHNVSSWKGRLICKLISLLVSNILVITKAREAILKDIGVLNTIYFPNCTKLTSVYSEENEENEANEANEVHCVCISQIASWKRIDKSIEVFKELSKSDPTKDWFLHIYGKPAKNDVKAEKIEQEIIEESRKCDGIYYHGYESNIKKVFDRTDILLSMSKNEPFGLVIIEALNSGCYILSSEGEGPNEIIVNDKIGKILFEGDSLVRWVNNNIGIILNNYSYYKDLRINNGARYSFEQYKNNVSSIWF